MKMRTLLILFAALNIGCGVSDRGSQEESVFIVSGQSNAKGCDWSDFPYPVINLAVGGMPIDALIGLLDQTELAGVDIAGIIFIHGEKDSKIQTYPPYYVERVNYYRSLIDKDAPFYATSVGYNANQPDAPFDALRKAQRDAWNIVYDEAWQFRDWDMLKDGLHFTQDGCRLIFDAIIERHLSGKSTTSPDP